MADWFISTCNCSQDSLLHLDILWGWDRAQEEFGPQMLQTTAVSLIYINLQVKEDV